MTDKELIETLRGRNGFGWVEDAADRIEQLVVAQDLLVAQRNAAWERDTYSFREWKAAEANLKIAEEIGRAFEEDAGQLRAKLAKAVEALRDVVSAKGLTDPIEYGYDAIKRARAVLEELEKPE